MSRRPLLVLALLLSTAALHAADPVPRPGRDWPGFRGIAASGIGDGGAPAK